MVSFHLDVHIHVWFCILLELYLILFVKLQSQFHCEDYFDGKGLLGTTSVYRQVLDYHNLLWLYGWKVHQKSCNNDEEIVLQIVLYMLLICMRLCDYSARSLGWIHRLDGGHCQGLLLSLLHFFAVLLLRLWLVTMMIVSKYEWVNFLQGRFVYSEISCV